jgi:hypothetical protein
MAVQYACHLVPSYDFLNIGILNHRLLHLCQWRPLWWYMVWLNYANLFRKNKIESIILECTLQSLSCKFCDVSTIKSHNKIVYSSSMHREKARVRREEKKRNNLSCVRVDEGKHVHWLTALTSYILCFSFFSILLSYIAAHLFILYRLFSFSVLLFFLSLTK